MGQGVFRSVGDLRSKWMCHIRHSNKTNSNIDKRVLVHRYAPHGGLVDSWVTLHSGKNSAGTEGFGLVEFLTSLPNDGAVRGVGLPMEFEEAANQG